MSDHPVQGCELCDRDGGDVVFCDDRLRVVMVDDRSYPGFCRVVWNAHAREMTDLPPQDRSAIMKAVCQVEAALHEVMRPHKVNLASLGNQTPHLHWHVIPRYPDDAHFPDPVWAAARRTTDAASLAARAALLPQLRLAIARRMAC